MPLIFFVVGRVSVGGIIPVGDGIIVGETVRWNLIGDCAKGVLVAPNLWRVDLVDNTVGDGVLDGRCTKPGSRFDPWLNNEKALRINTLITSKVVPIDKKDLIWEYNTPKFPSRS